MRIFTNFECLKDNSIMIGVIEDKNVEQEDHLHEFIEFTYVLEGEMTHYINGEKYAVKKGTMLIINEGEKHSFIAKGNVSYINLFIIPEKIEGFETCFVDLEKLDNNKTKAWKSCKDLPRCMSFSGVKLIEIENILRYMINEINARFEGYKLILKNGLFLLLTEIKRKSCEEGFEKDEYFGSIKLYEIINYVDDNFNKKITLVDVAKIYFCNPVYLGRLFKKFTGRSFIDYVRAKRIDKAIELLVTTNKRVEDIALEVGYQEKTQFYTLFRKQTGKTPKKFRNDIGNSKKVYNNMYKK